MTEEKPKLDTETRGHHPDSPSSLQASEACPLFENEQRESEASRIGTLVHKAVETNDLSILENEEQVLAAQKCLEYAEGVRAWFRAELQTEPLEIGEVYLAVGDDTVRDKNGVDWFGITGGFPDKVLYSLDHGVAHVLDWKNGKEPVTKTKDNLQGFSYVLGIFQKLGPRVKEVYMHFYHPNQHWSDDEQNDLYIARFTRDMLPAMELRVRTVIARKHSASAKPSPRTDLCLWCAKKGDCPALHNVAIQISPKYAEFIVPDVVDPLAPMLLEQRAVGYKFADQITAWAKAFKARQVEAVLENGIDIPGYKLIRRQDRTIESVGLTRSAAKKNGLTDEEFEATMTVSITKVEEAVKAKAPKGQGAAAVRQLASDLEELGAVGKAPFVHFLKEIKTPYDKL